MKSKRVTCTATKAKPRKARVKVGEVVARFREDGLFQLGIYQGRAGVRIFVAEDYSHWIDSWRHLTAREKGETRNVKRTR